MSLFNLLKEIKACSGKVITKGLSKIEIKKFINDKNLIAAIEEAYQVFTHIYQNNSELLELDEFQQIKHLQNNIVNFYDENAVNPFVPLAASGPWIITSKGAVIYDCGGYGMLGFGHAPTQVLNVMSQKQVMANVMTSSFSQFNLVKALQNEIGQDTNECPYSGFLFLNSGSEVVSVAARISDINARLMTDKGGRHEGKIIKHLALKGSFHGRTDRPAQFSGSTQAIYKEHLASFRDHDELITTEPNNLETLKNVFEYANANNIFIESMFIEPVMGEGCPGLPINREFYDLARQLTSEHGALLLVDSIQAGLRTHGCLSLVDYPEFEGIEAPDMETWSKALNAGQFPLSVLGLTPSTANIYKKGLYGNTMTSNPRAMDVATQVLVMITPSIRANIKHKGQLFLNRLKQLEGEFKGVILNVQGTGLLVSCQFHPEFKTVGLNSIEDTLRKLGVGIIHGGKNSLRFTPHFNLSSAEIELIISMLRQALLNQLQAIHSNAA